MSDKEYDNMVLSYYSML